MMATQKNSSKVGIIAWGAILLGGYYLLQQYQQLPESFPKVKMEVTVSGDGISRKCWFAADGTSGGDLSFAIPIKDVKIDVNIKKGNYTVSHKTWDFFKLSGDFQGAVSLKFAPAIKMGEWKVGMSMEWNLLSGEKIELEKDNKLKRDFHLDDEYRKLALQRKDASTLKSLGTLTYDPHSKFIEGQLSFEPLVKKPWATSTSPLPDSMFSPKVGTYELDANGRLQFLVKPVTSLGATKNPVPELKIDIDKIKIK